MTGKLIDDGGHVNKPFEKTENFDEHFEKYSLYSLQTLGQCALCQHIENNYPCTSICTCKVPTKNGDGVCPAFFLDPKKIDTIIKKLENLQKLEDLEKALKKSNINL